MINKVKTFINEALKSKKINLKGLLYELFTQEMASQDLGYTASNAKKE